MQRTTTMRSALAAAAMAIALCALAPDVQATAFDDASRYDVILSSQLFGAPADAASVTNTAPVAAPPPAARNLRLCGITTKKGGKTKVGFVDLSAKPEKNYLIYVGAKSADGYEVLDANLEDRKARIRKDGQEFELSMQTAAIGGAPGAGGAGLPAAVAAARAPTATSPGVNYLSRLRERREALRVRTVEPPKLTGEDLQQRYRDIQMEQIRKGGPTLPIPLTKEMDDTLVKEGVLPPTQGQESIAPAPQPEQPAPPAAE